MNKKAQATMELMILLVISMLGLVIIYSIYSQQISMGNFQREQFVANSSLNKIVNASNLLALLGPGSSTSVEVEFLGATRLNESIVLNNSILVVLSNGTELIASADVNFSGELRDLRGVHKINLYYDGNTVLIYYPDFELNQKSISFSTLNNSVQVESILIRNTSSSNLVFYIEKSFVDSEVTLTVSDDSFSLAPNQVKQVDLTFNISQSAYGNYSGGINIIATIFDRNISQNVNISVEVLNEFTPLLITPYSTSFNTYQGEVVTKNISLCNKTLNDITEVEWSKNGTLDANISEWFELPSSEITIPKGECLEIGIEFNVPNDAELKSYDGNLIALINGDELVTYFTAEVIPINKIFLQSVEDTSLKIDYSNSFFVKQNLNNFIIPTGEIDWNTQKDFEVNGSDWDQNLIAYYKFNDSNTDNYIFDSARGNDGLLINDANIFFEGMWDSNALVVDGDGDYVEILDKPIFNSLEKLTIVSWIKAKSWHDESWGGTIVGKDDWFDLSSNGFVFRTGDNGKLSFTIGHDSTWEEALSSSIMQVDQWYHVVGTFSGHDCNVYINSIKVGETSFSQTSIFDSTYPINIGRSPFDTSRAFNGSIDEVKIYNKVLSAEEIIADYNSFLSAKFVDNNIIDAKRVVDWNSFFINKNEIFENEREQIQLDFNFFTCSDALCNNKTSSQNILDVNNSIAKSLSSLSNSQYLGFETFFKIRSGLEEGSLAGDFFKTPFLKDINIIVN